MLSLRSLASIGLVALASPAFAAVQPGVVTAMVTHASGAPAVRATVTIHDQDRLVATATTNNAGACSFVIKDFTAPKETRTYWMVAHLGATVSAPVMVTVTPGRTSTVWIGLPGGVIDRD